MTTAEPVDASRLTVAVITRDRTDLLGRTLESVLAGTVVPGRVVVVDNSVVDPGATRSLCAGFGGRVDYLEPAGNLTLNGNHRRALGLASTELFGLMHDDDLYGPGFVEAGIRALTQYPGAVVFASNYAVIDEHDRVAQPTAWPDFPSGLVTSREYLLSSMGKRSPIHFSACLMRSEAVRACHVFEEDLNCGDMGFFFQLASLGDLVMTAEPLVSIRVHGAMLSDGAGYFAPGGGAASAALALFPLELRVKNRFLRSAQARAALGPAHARAAYLASRLATHALAKDLLARQYGPAVRLQLLRALAPLVPRHLGRAFMAHRR